MTGSIAGRINAMVDAALNQKPQATDEEITAAIMENPEIVWDVAIADVGQRVRKRMLANRRRAPHPYQALFDEYGFRDPSRPVTIKTGDAHIDVPPLLMDKADLRDWVRSLEIAAENGPKLRNARKLLEDFTVYERKYRKINVERYFDLLAAGTPRPEVTLLSQAERSEKIRQQWAALTPAQRRAVHEKRLKTRAENAAKKAGIEA